MRGKTILAGFALAGAVGLMALAPRSPRPAVDYREVANQLVKLNAGVREGEFVRINGGVRDVALLEHLAVAVRRQGAWPLITLGSDRLSRMMYDDVPAERDSDRPELAVRLVGLFPVEINVDFTEDESALDGVDPARLAARASAAAPVADLARDFGVRSVNVGNDLYPTAQRAELYGLTTDQLAEVFWGGMETSPALLHDRGAAIKRLLDGGRELHLSHPNGTDLTVSLGANKAFVSDGVVSMEDERVGGAATSVWLPAGEVFVAPMRGTATGVVVADHTFYNGHHVTGLTLEFKEGRLTGMSATKGIEHVRQMYDAAGAGRDEFSVIDIGLNPGVMVPEGSRMVNWVSAGMVSVGMGNNAWAGGANNANFSIYPHLAGATVTVDGVAIVEAGELVGLAEDGQTDGRTDGR